MAMWDENGRGTGGQWRTPSELRRWIVVALPLGFVAWAQSFQPWDFENALALGFLVWVSLWVTVWWPWSPTRRRALAAFRAWRTRRRAGS